MIFPRLARHQREHRRRRGALLAAALLSLTGLAGVGAAPALAAPVVASTAAALTAARATAAPLTVTRSYTMTFEGRHRQYTTVVPRGGSAGLPMVVFLSGTSATTSDEIQRDELLPYVRAGKVSLVYPIGLNRQWNVGPGCCTRPGTPKADDPDYVRAVTRLAVSRLRPNKLRISLVGYSAGAKLAWQIVCAGTGPFAAAATYGGNPETACPNRGSRIPVFIGFGAKDPEEPIAGKPTNKLGTHPPASVNISTWLQRDGCTTRRHKTVIDGRVDVTGWTPCANAGLTVQFGVWRTGTHVLPRPPATSAVSSFGAVAWRFVGQFSRP